MTDPITGRAPLPGGFRAAQDRAWASGIVAQCGASEVPVFVKQLGTVRGRELGAGPKGGDMGRWPADPGVREFPRDVVATPRAKGGDL
jgi:hypothetical protein